MTIRERISYYIRCFLTTVSPELNTKYAYKTMFKKKLDLEHPETLNEKILWLKFNDYRNNPLVKQCADKYKVRDYIKSIGCAEILNELIAVYERVEDIEWEKLPESFALKLNTGCGYNIIVPSKKELDIENAEKTIRKWMKTRYYLAYSEMQYKGVKPVILIEKYLKPENGFLPEDYKFYCFDGKAPYVMVCTDRVEGGKHSRFWYFNDQWEMQMLSYDALKYGAETVIPKPEGIDKAFEYARKLSKGFPFVRVDLYIVDGNVYFGELTFTPSAGLDTGRLPEADRLLGKYVERP